MLESGGEVDFAPKAIGAQDGGQLGAEDLQGNRAVVFEVLGEVDRGHPAAPELALDRVAIAEGISQW
jgi:hypothetical protein